MMIQQRYNNDTKLQSLGLVLEEAKNQDYLFQINKNKAYLNQVKKRVENIKDENNQLIKR